jgi:hypothetical protein
MELLRRYEVEYVVVGQVERYYYQAGGLAKFERMVGTHLERVYPVAEGAAPSPGAGATLDPAGAPTTYPDAEEAPYPAPTPPPVSTWTAVSATPGTGTVIYRVLP